MKSAFHQPKAQGIWGIDEGVAAIEIIEGLLPPYFKALTFEQPLHSRNSKLGVDFLKKEAP